MGGEVGALGPADDGDGLRLCKSFHVPAPAARGVTVNPKRFLIVDIPVCLASLSEPWLAPVQVGFMC